MQNYNEITLPASIYTKAKTELDAYIMRGIVRFLYTGEFYADYEKIKSIKSDPYFAILLNRNAYRYNLLQMALKYCYRHYDFLQANIPEISILAKELIRELQFEYRKFDKDQKREFVLEVKSLLIYLFTHI